jgi:hypothetical protein
MKRYYVCYTDEWKRGPMTFWVHIEADGHPWYMAERFLPPVPAPVPGKGFPYFFVEVDRFTFEFASLQELDVCIDTLSKKMLPSTHRETQARSTGPGKHWLNKMPGWTHPWRYRVNAVKVLREARQHFEQETGQALRRRDR